MLGAIAAILLLGGAWYTATLRAENTMLREQIASHEESGSVASAVQAGTATKPKSVPAVTAIADSRPQRTLSDQERSAMRAELSSQQGQKVWFETQSFAFGCDASRIGARPLRKGMRYSTGVSPPSPPGTKK